MWIITDADDDLVFMDSSYLNIKEKLRKINFPVYTMFIKDSVIKMLAEKLEAKENG